MNSPVLRQSVLVIDDEPFQRNSTLTLLHEMPCEELKIDRSFVQGAWRAEWEQRRAALTSAPA